MPCFLDRARAALLTFGLLAATPSIADEPADTGPIVLRTEALFYADNTEFAQRQDGETIIGAWDGLFLALPIGHAVELRAGIFANQRYGDDGTFIRPLLTVRVGSETNRFLFGTLETVRRSDGIGPDRTSLHGLLPAIQNERLAFTRPYEGGVQWLWDGAHVRDDLWFDYQKLNTPEHREVFDAGLAGRLRGWGPVSPAWQAHVVHHGGQLFGTGPVSDSYAYGAGLVVDVPSGTIDAITAEVYGLLSVDNPNREDHTLRKHGRGAFGRLAVEEKGWRAHFIYWRAKDWVKEEGDPNYSSRDAFGGYLAERTYWELGGTKAFKLAPQFVLEGSARFNHVEGKLEYSYRVLAAVGFDWKLRP